MSLLLILDGLDADALAQSVLLCIATDTGMALKRQCRSFWGIDFSPALQQQNLTQGTSSASGGTVTDCKRELTAKGLG